ncbi:competence/damage-inducible CinA C-terminal domain protein [Shigella flexneri 1485-80]|nr:competence/damage-inducible CinA C-terminal domain protein [Shigella flexneri 1485-80]
MPCFTAMRAEIALMSGSAFAVTHHAFSSGAGRTSDGNGSHASTLKSPSYTKSVSWQHYLENLTSALSQRLIADQLRLTTAESCTGGKLASALCAAEDTPKFYGAGFVTFTDQAKMKILSVSQQSLERYSAVSEKVAAEMATGAIERADADVSIAITGYGGLEGGEDGTPAGTVWFAWHIKGQTYTAVMHFAGDCETVLALAVRFALVQLLQLLL